MKFSHEWSGSWWRVVVTVDGTKAKFLVWQTHTERDAKAVAWYLSEAPKSVKNAVLVRAEEMD